MTAKSKGKAIQIKEEVGTWLGWCGDCFKVQREMWGSSTAPGKNVPLEIVKVEPVKELALYCL